MAGSMQMGNDQSEQVGFYPSFLVIYSETERYLSYLKMGEDPSNYRYSLPPFYSVDSFTHFTNGLYRIYGVGLPRYWNYSLYPIDSTTGLVAFYYFMVLTETGGYAHQDCKPIAMAMIDISMAHISKAYLQMISHRV